jgi:hypothetical protein
VQAVVCHISTTEGTVHSLTYFDSGSCICSGSATIGFYVEIVHRLKLFITSFEIVQIVCEDLNVQNSENFTFGLISGSGSSSSKKIMQLRLCNNWIQRQKCTSFEIVRSHKAIIVRRSILYETLRSKKYDFVTQKQIKNSKN